MSAKQPNRTATPNDPAPAPPSSGEHTLVNRITNPVVRWSLKIADRTTHWVLIVAALAPVVIVIGSNLVERHVKSGTTPLPGVFEGIGSGLLVSLLVVILALIGEMFRRDRKSERLISDITNQATERYAAIREQSAEQYGRHQELLERVVEATQLVSNFGDKLLRLQAREDTGIDFGMFAKKVMRDAETKLDRMVHDHSFQLDVQSPVDEFENLWLRQLIQGAGSFRTVSNLTIWSGRNLGFKRGADSMYLFRQLRACQEEDYRVQRVFVVPSLAMIRQLSSGAEFAEEAGRVLDRYERKVRSYARTLAIEKFRRTHKDQADACDDLANLPEEVKDEIESICGKYVTRIRPVDEAQYRAHFEGSRESGNGDGHSGNFAIFDSSRSNSEADPTHVVNTVTYIKASPPPSEGALPEYEIRSIGFTADKGMAKQKSEEFAVLWNSDRCLSFEAYRREVLERMAPSSKHPSDDRRTTLALLERKRELVTELVEALDAGDHEAIVRLAGYLGVDSGVAPRLLVERIFDRLETTGDGDDPPSADDDSTTHTS